MLPTAPSCPAYEARKGEDYADYDAPPERFIVVLNEIESEMRCIVDIENARSQSD